MDTKSTSPLARIAFSLPEARLDHGLSQRDLAALSVSLATVGRAERGLHVSPASLVKVGAALVVLDAYRPPDFDHDVNVLLHVVAGERAA